MNKMHKNLITYVSLLLSFIFLVIPFFMSRKTYYESTLPFIKIKIFLILSHRRPEVVTDN